MLRKIKDWIERVTLDWTSEGSVSRARVRTSKKTI